MHGGEWWLGCIVGSGALLAVCFQGLAQEQASGVASSRRWGPVDQAALEADIRFLADDSLAGRALGSPGLDAAAGYHEKIFRELGMVPFSGEGFYQQFSLVGSLPSPDSAIVIASSPAAQRTTSAPSELSLRWQDDMVVVTHRRDVPALVEAEAVYAGHFVDAPELEWDDVKGTDLAGKVLIVEINEPDNRPGGMFEGTAMTWYGRWGYKFEHAARLGAAGVLIIHDDVGAGYGWPVVRNGWSREELFAAGASTEKLAFLGWVTGPVGDRILEMAGKERTAMRAAAQTREFRTVPLGLNVRVAQSPSFRQIAVSNVVGMLKSPRAEAENRYVVLSAHYDHIGVDTSRARPSGELSGQRPQDAADGEGGASTGVEDRVYNGAVDNCSASAALLATARVLAARREDLDVNVVFLAATAEEDGLLGSDWFVNHLPVPRAHLLANVNFEMTNVWGRTLDAYCISARHSDMEPICREAAELAGMELIDERDGEKGYPFRSDQHSFVKAGIPGVWLHEGVRSAPGAKYDVAARRVDYEKNHYHQVTDNIRNDWDLEGTVQTVEWAVRLVEVLGRWEGVPGFGPRSPFQRHRSE